MYTKLDHVKSPHSWKEVEEEESGNQDSLVKHFPFTEHCQLSDPALQLLACPIVLWNWYLLPLQWGKPSLCSYSYVSHQQQKSRSEEKAFPSPVISKCSFSNLNT